MTPPKKALWAANTYWDSPFQVGANHLAREFVRRGWQVGFVSDPVSPWHFLSVSARISAWDRLRTWRAGGGRDLEGRLFHYSPFTLFPPQNKPLLRGPWALERWMDFTLPNVGKKMSSEGFGEVDLLVIDTVPQHFWLDRVQAKRTVFRVTDQFSGFAKATPAMLEKEKELARRVDLVVYTAKSLEPHVRRLKPRRMLHVPNGVNFRFFNDDKAGPPEEYQGIAGPIAVYVGAIEEWFNFDWMNRAVEGMPDVTFVVIGPEGAARRRLKKAPNLRLLGRKPHTRLPAYLKHADVGIIPFDVEGHAELVDRVNPMKLYEYMACGLPVVASSWEELRLVKSPALLCRDAEGFVRGLRKVLKGRPASGALRDFARAQSWEGRATRFLRKAMGAT